MRRVKLAGLEERRALGLLLVAALLSHWATTSGCATAIDTQPGGDASGLADGRADAGGLCGNGVVEAGEECDDHNLLPGDGCSPICELEECDSTTCFGGCCDASGDCQNGLQDTACGRLGEPCQDCTAQERICDDHVCTELTGCTPDETMECGLCGLRTCGANGEWGLCEGQGVCAPDAVQFVGSCGDCGRELRTCQQDCTWGESSCEDEGECTPDTVETRDPCGCCGIEERICTATCAWPAFACAHENTCDVGTCCDCQCVDTASDEDYCGDCYTECTGTDLCCDSQCRDIQNDDDYCGSCTVSCGGTTQCCGGTCDPYVCLTASQFSFAEDNPDWPNPPPSCPGGSFTVGYLTEIHWDFHRMYAICVNGATAGSIQTCSEATGSCTPPDCPSGQTSLGIFHDKTNNADHTLQRVCVAEAESGSVTTCTNPIGDPHCSPPACPAGNVDLGLVAEFEPLTDTTTFYRFCVVPTCPPSCQ